jgi:uncharacterized protein (TIGR03083 family)
MLSTCWRDWAARLNQLDSPAWLLPTRCGDWTVHHLAAHVAPDPSVLAGLESVASSTPAKVDDAADLLRRFNQPGGIAHELAAAVAEQARLSASLRQKEQLIEWFSASAAYVDAAQLDMTAAAPHPVVDSVTVEVLAEVSLMEATVHLLDLIAAVGGPAPSADAIAATQDLLLRVADPIRVIEVAAGRVRCESVFPAIR